MSCSTTPDGTAPPRLLVRLSVMMLLEFFVYASWYPTLGLVLRSSGLASVIGSAYALGAVAALSSPLVMGAIGDRFLSTQKLLGLSHLVGFGVMLVLPGAVAAGHATLTLALVFAYMFAFVPTIGIVNAVALRHLGPNRRLFPYVRLFGTLGWVIAGLTVGALGLSSSTGVFRTAAAASLVLGLYAFTLPSTPPAARGARFSMGDLIGAKAFVLFRDRNFAVLILCAILTSISTGLYNSYTSPFLGALGISNIAGVMALAQLSEITFIATIPFVLKRIGMKWAMLLGMAMWGVRFALFAGAAAGQPGLAILAICLHGVCSDFFVIVAAMFIDRVSPTDVKAQAQNLLTLVISGFGTGIGSFMGGRLYAATVALDPGAGRSAWVPLWLAPIGAAVVTSVLWIVLFRPSRSEERDVAGSGPALAPASSVDRRSRAAAAALRAGER